MEKIINKSNSVSFENERIIANILHDVKSPLYSIKIALQTKLENELNKDIYETTSNTIKYIENFLVDYNFRNGKFNNIPSECNIPEIINEKIENYKYIFINKKIHINIISKINKNYKINSIKVFLSSIIGNLISNIAFHASDNQEATIKLEKKENFILIDFQNSFRNHSENSSMGLEFCEKLSKIINANIKLNKTKNRVKVELKIPDLAEKI